MNRSEHDGVVAERHPQFGHHPIEVDAELVGQAQDLALADVQVDHRLARVVAQDAPQLVDLQLAQRGGRHLQVQRQRRRRVEALEDRDVLGHEARPATRRACRCDPSP